MPKIKIDVPGWEAFNGYMGTLEFANGVSVRDATAMEVMRLGANIRITEVGSDEQVGPATTMVDANHVSAVVETTLQTESDEQAADTTKDEDGYTEEQLNEVADSGGIKALREIADTFGVKGVAVASLVKGILEAQKAK
jgi:hypothetical protein